MDHIHFYSRSSEFICTELAEFLRTADRGVTQYAGSDEMYSA